MHGSRDAGNVVALPNVDRKLEWIAPDQITNVWDLIKPGVLNLEGRSKEGWRAEDIYAALRTGSSALHIGYGTEYLGFMVTTLLTGYRDKSLNIWLCFNASKEDIIDLFSEDVTEIAKTAGAKRISFYSPRNWERRLKDYGFLPARTLYEKEV